ncbi:MAG: PEP-CTERM sorting domain-containing protein [Planctomycetota bacterium]
MPLSNITRFVGLATLLLFSTSRLNAGDFDLNFVADGESRWIDHFSDAFGQIDQGWDGDPAIDGFFLYSELPNFVRIGGGADLFPSEENFADVGSISFDDSTGEITAITMDIDDYVARNFSILENQLGPGYTASFSNIAGTVTQSGNDLSAINLTADIAFTYGEAPTTVSYNGDFAISNDQFTINVDETNTIPFGGGSLDVRYAWELSGLVSGLVAGISGDFDGDGDYACADVDTLVSQIVSGNNDGAFDLDGDGLVNSADLDAWLAEAGNVENVGGGAYLKGDANLDGVVDISDFNIWNANKFSNTEAWCQADFNADGVTDTSDFNIWNANKFQSADATAVPEPSGLFLLMAAMIFSVRKLRRSI